MQFTGERYVTNCEAFGYETAYEHWHRYLYAAQFVAGKAVLDIACGEGYGSDYLARTAKQVIGVDVDPQVVRHASSKYLRPNLEFRVGSVEAVPLEGRHVLDAVVSFETIEHVWEEQQLKFLGEVERLLKPDGVLVVSTPNKLLYSDEPGCRNEFHRKEFYYDEYLALLKRFFRTVHVLGQKVYPASYLWPLGGPLRPATEHQLACAGGHFGPANGDKKEALFLVAVCSNGAVEVPGGSVLLDVSERATRRRLEELAAKEAASAPAHDATLRAIAEFRQAFEQQVREEAAQQQLREAARENEARQREFAELESHTRNLAKENEALRSELAEFQRHAQALTRENEAIQREAAEQIQALTREIEANQRELTEHQEASAKREEELSALTARVQLMASREKELREMYLDAHDQLLRRDEELQAALAAALQEAPGATATIHNAPVVTGAIASNKASVPGSHLPYQRMIHDIRGVVGSSVPPGATVLVISKGDENLLKLGGRTGWHFPQNERGIYAGYNPADSAAAIDHLEQLRAKGADFLVLPATALWWLDHYAEFRRHLEQHYREVVRREGTCVIFALREPPVPERQQYQQLIHDIRDVVGSSVPPKAVVLVVSKGDEELLKLGARTGWHFPQDERGVYAGYNPANSAAAIAHLEQLRAKGADFLLFPATALWWLDHYNEFRRHLEGHYHPVVSQPDTCVIFDLHTRPELPARHDESVTQTARARKPFGVNLIGPLASEKGAGEAGRSMIRAMEAAGIPYGLNNFADPYSVHRETSSLHVREDNPYSVNLLKVEADSMDAFLLEKGEAYLRDHYNIGYWVWELSQFPEEWQSRFRHFDEIWVPTDFVLDAVSRVAPVPVVKVPHTLAEDLMLSPLDRAHFGLPQKGFLFLFMFDFMSCMERKNPLGLISVFRKAFPGRDDAWLVLKCAHGESSPEEFRAVREAAKGANITILDSVLSREEVNTLLYLSDCYVSLHRSEGFGLTLAEAMSLEKPVIATGYSGNTDFMNPGNSFLVNYRLAELAQDYQPYNYKKGGVWAEPDLGQAAELMRFVFANREAAAEVGRTARQDVLRILHPRVVGGLIKERLLKIAHHGKIAAPGDVRNGQTARAVPPVPTT